MRGMTGIAVAAALGILGALGNWYYVYRQARGYRPVRFVAIGDDAVINPGDRFREGDLVPVGVPKEYVGELENVAIPWEDRVTVTGMPAIKSYRGGEILLRTAIETPAQRDLTERLGEDEVLFPVAVDSSTFIPEHYDPGDSVRFFLPETLQASGAGSGGAGTTSTVGPFRVLALGNRKGKRELATAYDQRPTRENVVTIALQFPFDAKANALLRLLGRSGGRGLRIIKHKPDK